MSHAAALLMGLALAATSVSIAAHIFPYNPEIPKEPDHGQEIVLKSRL
jgi:hypothetical protein